MSFLSFIIWAADPEIFIIPFSKFGGSDRPIVWYGFLFALGFIISQQILYRIFRADGEPPKDVDILTTYMVLATIIGARLGHCLFYNPGYYLSNPIEILKIWEGGLASHGGAIGILVAIWIYSRYDIRVNWMLIIPVKFSAKRIHRKVQSYLWVLDRLAIVTIMTGALIRTGNFFNSEMEGTPTGSDYGVVYARGAKEVLNFDPQKVETVRFEKLDKPGPEPGKVPIKAIVELQRGVEADPTLDRFVREQLARSLNYYTEVVQHLDFGEELNVQIKNVRNRNQIEFYAIGTVRHAAQLYEAAACMLIFFVLLWIWRYRRYELPVGFLFSLFMMLLWIERFFNEFFKMPQETFEENMALNMGQLLSIPMFLFGLATMIYSYRKNGRLKPPNS